MGATTNAPVDANHQATVPGSGGDERHGEENGAKKNAAIAIEQKIMRAIYRAAEEEKLPRSKTVRRYCEALLEDRSTCNCLALRDDLEEVLYGANLEDDPTNKDLLSR